MSAYLGSTKVWDSSGGAAADENGWVRPSDWLAMPDVSPTEQKIVGLYAVFPEGGNYVALQCANNYTVNWGDGSTQNYSAYEVASHEYAYSSIALDGTLCDRGYKQAIITVTPQTSNNLTYVTFQYRYSGLYYGVLTGWLDLVISLPYCTNLVIGGSEIGLRLLERVMVKSTGALSSAPSFINCHSLQSLTLDGANLASVSSLEYFLYNCFSIKHLDLSSVSLPSVTTFNWMCGGCRNLISADLSSCITSSATILSDVFNSCALLQSVNLSSSNTASVTTFASMFNGCNSLRSLDLSAFTLSGSASTSDMFNDARGLSSLLLPASNSFSVAYCKLSATALNALYTSLPTVSGKTITVTGNYGTSGHTPSIATAKGWTVTA